MAAKNKTIQTDADVISFVNRFVETESKKTESFQLIENMSKWAGATPVMWGPTIIGFGHYMYQYESGHSGESPLIAFSPRKTSFSLYVYMPTASNIQLVKNLGNFKMGKACIYVKKLADIHMQTLEKICKNTIEYLQNQYK